MSLTKLTTNSNPDTHNPPRCSVHQLDYDVLIDPDFVCLLGTTHCCVLAYTIDLPRPENFELPASWFVATHSIIHFSLLIQGLLYHLPPTRFGISKSSPRITAGFSSFSGRIVERLLFAYLCSTTIQFRVTPDSNVVF